MPKSYTGSILFSRNTSMPLKGNSQALLRHPQINESSFHSPNFSYNPQKKCVRQSYLFYFPYTDSRTSTPTTLVNENFIFKKYIINPLPFRGKNIVNFEDRISSLF